MDSTLILLLIPVLILQFALQLYALYDVAKRRRTRDTSQTILWIVIIVVLNLLGPIIYFALAKREQAVSA